MPPVGLIRNPRATRGGAGEVPAAVASALMIAAPEDFAGLDQALAAMAAAGVRILAIEGGDGTVREVISRATGIWAGAPVRFAIIPVGNTNLIARKTGGVTLTDLPELAHAARETRLPILRADRADAPPIRGFILGTGAYAAATRFAQEEIAARHGPQVLLAVLRFLFSRRLRAPSDIGFACDGVAGGGIAPRLGVALTTLPGALIYGIEPFWGGGEGPIRWLDVAANPPRLIRAAFHVVRGKPRRWMKTHYRSGRSGHVTLRLTGEFVMDGECFAPGPDGVVDVSATEAATFLTR